jgi:hypothetical protein
VDKVYFIGYKVLWQNVNYPMLVWQWKECDDEWVERANIPAALVFRKDVESDENILCNYLLPYPLPSS